MVATLSQVEVEAEAELALTPVIGLLSHGPDAEEVLVAIPAFNEERFIGSVVHEVRMLGYRCLLIDDGSSDRTAAIANAAGARIERHASNRGKAAAMNTAFEVARREGVSILVVMDGDAQHDPCEIHDLIRPIRAGEADVVSGSRFIARARGQVPGVRAIGMRALTAGANVASGQPMTDTFSGFRAFGRAAIEALRFKSDGFDVELEMQFMTRSQHLRQREVPITAHYDDLPKRNVFQYGVGALGGLVRLAARFRPLLFFGVPGTLTLLAGILIGVLVIETYQQSLQFAAGQALVAVLLTILGSIGLFAAIVVHFLRRMFVELEGQLSDLSAAASMGGSRPRKAHAGPGGSTSTLRPRET